MTDSKGLFIPRVVMDDEILTITMKVTYAIMIEGMDDNNICRLSSQEIGERLNVTPAAASYTRLRLCELGYIHRIPKTRNNYKLVKIKRKRKEPRNE